MKRFLAQVALVALPMSGCCFGQTTSAGGPLAATGPITVVSSGFAPDPMILAGVAGGPTDATTMNATCRGHVSITPSHTLSVPTPMASLRIMASAESDTTLVVQLSDGRFVCNDDSDGFDPSVDLVGIPAGQHNVYVGTYAPGTTTPYRLGITSNPSLTPSSMTQPIVQPTVQPAIMPGTVLRAGTATIQIASGNLPGVTPGAQCTFTQTAVDPAMGFDCRWVVVCAGVTVYGEGDGGFNPCSDPSWPPGTQVADTNTSGGDRDPSLVINAGGMMVRDDAQGARGEYQITATMTQGVRLPPG